MSFCVTSCSTSPSAMVAEASERMPQHLQRAVLDHQLEGAGEQEVADQHARLVAEQRIGAGLAPPQRALVDHVIVQQRRRVDELHAGGERHVALAAIAAEPRRREGQQRPQPLAAGRDDMRRQLRDQRDRAVHPLHDQPVAGLQVVAWTSVDQRRRARPRRHRLASSTGNYPAQSVQPLALRLDPGSEGRHHSQPRHLATSAGKTRIWPTMQADRAKRGSGAPQLPARPAAGCGHSTAWCWTSTSARSRAASAPSRVASRWREEDLAAARRRAARRRRGIVSATQTEDRLLGGRVLLRQPRRGPARRAGRGAARRRDAGPTRGARAGGRLRQRRRLPLPGGAGAGPAHRGRRARPGPGGAGHRRNAAANGDRGRGDRPATSRDPALVRRLPACDHASPIPPYWPGGTAPPEPRRRRHDPWRTGAAAWRTGPVSSPRPSRRRGTPTLILPAARLMAGWRRWPRPASAEPRLLPLLAAPGRGGQAGAAAGPPRRPRPGQHRRRGWRCMAPRRSRRRRRRCCACGSPRCN